MKIRLSQLRLLIKEEIEQAQKKSVSYAGIVLDQTSHDALMKLVPKGWDSSKTCHHCTLTMGPWKGDPDVIGKKITLNVKGFVQDDKVCAVGVELPAGIATKGPPHVSVAVTNSGKPFLAGKLDYSNVTQPEGIPDALTGTVKEVAEGDYSLSESRQYIYEHVKRWQRLAGLIK